MLAIVTTFYSRVGGISTFIKEIEKNLITINPNFRIFSPDFSPTDISSRRFKIKGRARLSIIIDLFMKLFKFRPRFIHCHGAWYLQFSCILYKLLFKAFGKNITLIFIKHSDIRLKKTSFKLKVFKFIDQYGNFIVFVSNYLKKKYVTEFGYTDNECLIVIPPGSREPGMLDSSIVDKLSSLLKNKGPVLTYIGLFEYDGKVQGLCLLLDSLKILKDTYKNIVLIVCGRGSKKSKITKKIRTLSLEENVFILENVTNPYNIYSVSDIHCHISFQEGFSLVPFEALAAKVPVVATESGDLSTVKIQGLFLTPADATIISKTIHDKIQGKIHVDSSKVLSDFSWKRTATAFEKLGKAG